MAIRPEHDHYAVRESEEGAVRLAHRNRRADRRRAERRRARVLIISALALGLVLMAGGLTALGSTRGITDVGRAATAVSRRVAASPQQRVAQVATVTAVAVADGPSPAPRKRAAGRPAPDSKKRVVGKPRMPIGTVVKAEAKPRPTSILVRKCSAGCHATPALLTLRFDSASAAIVVDGMVEAQGVRLTKQERAAVIAVLSRK